MLYAYDYLVMYCSCGYILHVFYVVVTAPFLEMLQGA